MFSRSQRGHLSRGQSLVEFALVAPIVIAVMAAIIQFGIVFWAQNTLTQVVRDTGRWAATQQNCKVQTPVWSQAQAIAASSSLIGYSATNFVPTVTWDSSTAGWDPTKCPDDNTVVEYVHVTATTRVPTFFPGMEYLPALGTCDPNCHITLSSTAQFRMEPHP